MILFFVTFCHFLSLFVSFCHFLSHFVTFSHFSFPLSLFLFPPLENEIAALSTGTDDDLDALVQSLKADEKRKLLVSLQDDVMAVVKEMAASERLLKVIDKNYVFDPASMYVHLKLVILGVLCCFLVFFTCFYGYFLLFLCCL